MALNEKISLFFKSGSKIERPSRASDHGSNDLGPGYRPEI
jgi:hypothetical protein